MIRIVKYFVDVFSNKQNEKLLSNMNDYEKNESKKIHSRTYSFFTEENKKNQ
mgnify:CR=1 FL=1|tara:strand:- start:5251 stop:5406 length:156 start_codon:yes stop_codon:yes gene_type:complete